jgi:hypothetical protein
MRKHDRTWDTIFTWKTIAGKNHRRQPTIFTMMRELQRREYNEPSRSSRAAYKMYIWWNKLTTVKDGNKSAKHITRTVGPPGVPTRHMLRIRIIFNRCCNICFHVSTATFPCCDIRISTFYYVLANVAGNNCFVLQRFSVTGSCCVQHDLMLRWEFFATWSDVAL